MDFNEQQLTALKRKVQRLETGLFTEAEIREIAFALATLIAENRRFAQMRDTPERRYGLDVL